MNHHKRLVQYAEHYFQRSGKTQFPTIRQAARALHLRQREIEELCDELPLMLTSYYTNPPQTLAEHFVEVCP